MKKFLLFTLCFVVYVNLAEAATYYVDYVSGSNSNSGLTTALPWKVAPGMVGCTGSCAAHNPASPGDRFIFKGGVTWPSATLPLVITQVNRNGSNVANTYYGVDTDWPAGGSSKPIFNGEYKSTSLVTISYSNNILLEGLELKGLYVPADGIYGTVSVGMWESKNVEIKDCFIHDWKLDSAATDDDAHGGVFFQDYGGTSPSIPEGVVVDSCEISNAEWSSTRNNGVAVRAVQTIRNSKIHDVPTAALHVAELHDNILYNIDSPIRDFDQGGSNGQPYHTNLMYVDQVVANSPILFVYNNLIYNIGAGTGIYLEPCFAGSKNATIYVFNNVMFASPSVASGGNMVLEPEAGSGSCGKIYAYNNTMQSTSVAMANVYVNHTGTNNIDTAVFQNNHYITSGGYVVGATSSIGHYTNDATNIGATNSSYTAANRYAPLTSSDPTIGKGANLTSLCSTNPSLAALCKDTTLGGTRIPNARPATGNWDAGAYQFSTATAVSPVAPSNLRVQ